MPKSNLDLNQLASSIADLLNSRFKEIEVIDVKVENDIDRDGDRILRILAVFKGEIKEADAKVVAGAVRQLRPALASIDEDTYPLLSFVSKSEYENRV